MSDYLAIRWQRVERARPPVMLLGGLNLARALGLAGIGCIVASAERFTPAMASRYAVGRCVLPAPALRPALAERLVHAAGILERRLGVRLPLVYGDDDQLDFLHEYRNTLAPHFAFILNDPGVAAALGDKGRFHAFARSRGLPVPRSLALEELDGFAGPVLVKPKTKTQWDRSPVRRELLAEGEKARLYASGRAALGDARVAALADGLVFQEYVPGDDSALWSFHGVADEKGELLATFTGRKLRTFPPLTGESTCLEIAHDDTLQELGRDIAARLPLKGPFKIDFKRHAGNGRFYVLEINARFTLWHYLGAAAGVNLAAVAYDYLMHGERPGSLRARAGYRWLSPRFDYRAYRELGGRGALGVAAWLASLATAPNVYDFFSWSDPLPFVAETLARARRVPRKVGGRIRQWLSTAS